VKLDFILIRDHALNDRSQRDVVIRSIKIFLHPITRLKSKMPGQN